MHLKPSTPGFDWRKHHHLIFCLAFPSGTPKDLFAGSDSQMPVSGNHQPGPCRRQDLASVLLKPPLYIYSNCCTFHRRSNLDSPQLAMWLLVSPVSLEAFSDNTQIARSDWWGHVAWNWLHGLGFLHGLGARFVRLKFSLLPAASHYASKIRSHLTSNYSSELPG